jgi:hypothetical protein
VTLEDEETWLRRHVVRLLGGGGLAARGARAAAACVFGDRIAQQPFARRRPASHCGHPKRTPRFARIASTDKHTRSAARPMH